MRGLLWLVALALAALLTGCSAGVPFEPARLTPVPPMTAAEVAGCDWTAAPGPWLIRHGALLELGRKKLALTGLLRLDPEAKRARLVGLDDLGVKLFDLTVTAEGMEKNFLLPPLEKLPGLPEAVAASVRRVFLAPRPDGGDRLQAEVDRYRLVRDGAGQTVFVFGGEPLRLLEKAAQGPEDEWRVRYFEYRSGEDWSWPRGIVVDDEAAGYRLTLWLENVKRM